MTTLIAKSQQQMDPPALVDYEMAMITSLHEAMGANGISVSQDHITNFYVALKSKPLAILAGPVQSGKITLVQCLAQSLVKQDGLHVQMLTGHPWWAERCDDIASYTGLHSRFSAEKILALIEEASQPENAQQPFIACLTRISPAELLSFFTEVACQLRNGQIMRLGDVRLSEPIPFPSNLRIIGTMDTSSFDWWDQDLLENSTVIRWPPGSIRANSLSIRGVSSDEPEFLRSSIRQRDRAYRKVFPVLRGQRQPFYPLLQLGSILKDYISSSLEQITDDVVIYLANSWSRLGNGLFHPSPARNLAIGLDLAIAQTLLPRAAESIQRLETLRDRLETVFAGQFPHSAAFVAALAAQG